MDIHNPPATADNTAFAIASVPPSVSAAHGPPASSAGGAFVASALDLYDHGLCPVPTGGDDGNQPLIRWGRWRSRPKRSFFEALAGEPRFANANVGILTGLSRVTVIDIDADPEVCRPLESLCGATPLVTRTPSGGAHWWYRSAGEPCRNLRGLGYPADVKGIGGLIIVPPSVRPTGPHAGHAYVVEVGDWGVLRDLPPLRADAQHRFGLIVSPTQAGERGDHSVSHKTVIRPGGRNIQLFNRLRPIARAVDSKEELLEEAAAFNRMECDPPLPDSEVARCAASVWRYQQEGRNYTGAASDFHATPELRAVMDLIADPNAIALYLYLCCLHPREMATGQPFAIAVRAMAAAKTVPGLGERALRLARDHILKVGLLVQVHRGGAFAGDPALFAFATSHRPIV